MRARRELDPLDIADVEQREVEAAAKRVHADTVDEHEREVRLAAARKHGSERAAPAAAADRQAGQGAQGIAKALHLPLAQLGRRDHRHAAAHVLERRLDLRGGHDHRLRDGSERERNVKRTDLVGSYRRRLRCAVQARRVGEQAIGPGRKVRHGEATVAVREHGAGAERSNNGDAHRPDRSSTRIGDDPAHLGGVGGQDACGEHERHEQENRRDGRGDRTSVGRSRRRRRKQVHGTPSGVCTRRDLLQGDRIKDGPGPGFLTCGSPRLALRLPMPAWSTVTEPRAAVGPGS